MGTWDKPGWFLALCVVGLAHGETALAIEWQVAPQVDVAETYSDNITLAPDTAIASEDYVTQIAPSIAVKGKGSRLTLDSRYTLQNLYYAKDSDRNQSHNQFHLATDAELIDQFFYLSASAQIVQQQLTAGGVVADNLNVNSGRGDVVTTRIEPRIKRRLGKFVEFDLSYSEGRINYDSDSIADGRLEETKLLLGRSQDSTKLDWQLRYSQSEQWVTDTLSVERQQSAATFRYPAFDSVSLVANGGREEGRISNSRNYQEGAYWSAGLRWDPSPHFSLEAASGDKDQQARLSWIPSIRTSVNVSYLNRDVGVRVSDIWTATFQHTTRRTRWLFTRFKEITNDATLAIVDVNGDLIRGESYLRIISYFGITEESFARTSSEGSVMYGARRNDFSLGINSEQRDYQLSGRQSQLHGGYLGWGFKLSAKASSDLKYRVDRSTGNSGGNDIETVSLAWSLKRSFGKQISAGLEMRTIEIDGGVANVNRSENRLSANARVIF